MRVWNVAPYELSRVPNCSPHASLQMCNAETMEGPEIYPKKRSQIKCTLLDLNVLSEINSFLCKII